MTIQSLLAFIEVAKREGKLFDTSPIAIEINGTQLPDSKDRCTIATDENDENPVLVLAPEI